MGTRGLVHVCGEKQEIVATIYRQWDCYPAGMGMDLKRLLTGFRVVNGIPGGDTSKMLNGVGDAATYLVCALKGHDAKPWSPGGLYVEKTGARGHGEDYTYWLTFVTDQKIWMRIASRTEEAVYAGWLDDFDASKLEES